MRVRVVLGTIVAASLGMSMPQSVPVSVAAIPVPAAAASPTGVARTATVTGRAFDICDAPSLATLAQWKPAYQAINVYIGGVNRGCPVQTHLSSAWVAAATAAGWYLVPTYVGRQSPCELGSSGHVTITNAAQGVTAADDAVAQAQALGITSGAPIYYDLESYSTTDAACRNLTMGFIDQWT